MRDEEPNLRRAALILVRKLAKHGRLAREVWPEMEAVRDALVLDPNPEPALSGRFERAEAELAELRVSVINLMRTVEAQHRPATVRTKPPTSSGDDIPF